MVIHKIPHRHTNCLSPLPFILWQFQGNNKSAGRFLQTFMEPRMPGISIVSISPASSKVFTCIAAEEGGIFIRSAISLMFSGSLSKVPATPGALERTAPSPPPSASPHPPDSAISSFLLPFSLPASNPPVNTTVFYYIAKLLLVSLYHRFRAGKRGEKKRSCHQLPFQMIYTMQFCSLPTLLRLQIPLRHLLPYLPALSVHLNACQLQSIHKSAVG